jgi:predicted lipoprotein with Yx(FWY)xxD motif
MCVRCRGARIAAVMGSLLAAGLLAAACSTSSSASGSGAGAAGNTSSSPSASGGTVSTKSTSLGTVLVTSSGLTLYHLTTEHNGQIQCTGSCATTWPPYTVSAGTTPTGMSGLGTLMRPDGTTQVTYNGEALYRYTGDSAPGDTNGNGISGVWFAVKTTGTSGSTGSSTSSGGYNYGGGGY